MYEHAAELPGRPVSGAVRVGPQPPAARPPPPCRSPAPRPPGRRTPRWPGRGSGRPPTAGPRPGRSPAQRVMAPVIACSSPASRSTGANSRTSAGSGSALGAAPRQHPRRDRGHVGRVGRGAMPSTCQPAAQRSGVGIGRHRGGDRGQRRVGSVGPLGEARTSPGSASTASGSGRSISAARPGTRRPRRRRPPRRPAPSGPRRRPPLRRSPPTAGPPSPRSAGWASPGPPPPASAGGAQARAGRTCRNAATRPRASSCSACQPAGQHRHDRARTSRRPARRRPSAGRSPRSGGTAGWPAGADRSQPSAACSGGLAAATTATSGGSDRSPTTRSSTTRSSAACTAGGAVDSSSRNSSPWPASASRRGPGGRREPAPRRPTTMGSPAKSDGSRIEAITVSQGQPMASAMARMVEVLPVPGAPHSSTGTRAATATPRATTTGFCCSPPGPTVTFRLPPRSHRAGARLRSRPDVRRYPLPPSVRRRRTAPRRHPRWPTRPG